MAVAKRIGALGMICSLGLGLACGSAYDDTSGRENLRAAQSALTLNNSLVREYGEVIEDATSAAISGLSGFEQLNDVEDNGGYFALAYNNAARNRLAVQLWELKDRDAQPGALYRMEEWSTAVSTITRVRVAGLTPDKFVVASREGGQLKLRSFFANGNHISLGATFATGQSINQIVLTRVMQSPDAANPFQFATATTDGTGRLKVTTWTMNASTGAITQLSSAVGDTVKSLAAAAPDSPRGMLTTSTVLAATNELKVTAWQVAENGTLTLKSSYVEPADITHISSSRAGYSRTAVAYNTGSGAGSKVAVFEVDNTWTISKVSEANLGSAADDPREVTIASGGAGRVFLAGDTSTSANTIRSWSTVDGLKQIAALVRTDTGRRVSGATVLKGDRLILTALKTDGTVEVTSWRDYYSPLARGVYGSPLPAAPAGDSLTETPFFPPSPNSGDPERLIAASPHYVVTCGTGSCTFNDKAGVRLPAKSASFPTNVSIGALFAPLEDQLQRNIEIQDVCDPELADSTSRCPLAASAYDSRVIYAQEINRFVIVTQFRHHQGDNYGRYFGIAVSQTEDPRDGFYVFANLESISRDDPKAAAAGGVLTLSHHNWSDTPPDDTTSASWKPAMLVLDLQDLASNAAFISNTKLTGPQAGSGNNDLPLHFSEPRRVFSPEGAFQTLWSDLTVFYKSKDAKLGAFFEDVEGPVTVHYADYPLGSVSSGNNSEYQSLFTKETSDGVYSGELYRVGRTSSTLQLQQVKIALQRGVGFTSVIGAQRDIPCSHCVQPTTATYNGKILIAFTQGNDVDDGSNAMYMYLDNFNATPITKVVKAGDTSLASNPPQNYQIAPDTGGNGDVLQPHKFTGFWMTHSYSKNGASAPVEMRVIPH
jgi:hypothetical protein